MSDASGGRSPLGFDLGQRVRYGAVLDGVGSLEEVAVADVHDPIAVQDQLRERRLEQVEQLEPVLELGEPLVVVLDRGPDLPPEPFLRVVVMAVPYR